MAPKKFALLFPENITPADLHEYDGIGFDTFRQWEVLADARIAVILEWLTASPWSENIKTITC